MTELMVNVDETVTPQLPKHKINNITENMGISLVMPTEAVSVHARKAGEPADLENNSSEETFETPPTTPPPLSESSVEPFGTRKRSCPDSMQAPHLRNVSRKTSNETSAQEVSNLNYPTGVVNQSKG